MIFFPSNGFYCFCCSSSTHQSLTLSLSLPFCIYLHFSLCFSLSVCADRSVVVGLLTASARRQPGLFISSSVPDPSPLSHTVLLALITTICERAGETGSRTRTCDLLLPLATANHRPCYQLLESGSVKGDGVKTLFHDEWCCFDRCNSNFITSNHLKWPQGRKGQPS